MKIAMVDLEQAIAQSSQGEKLQQDMTDFQRSVNGRMHGAMQELHELRNRINHDASTLTTEQLTELKRKHQLGSERIQRFREEQQREGEQLRHEGMETIKALLPAILHRLRVENGYALIVHADTVLSAPDGLDITATVAKRLSETE